MRTPVWLQQSERRGEGHGGRSCGGGGLGAGGRWEAWKAVG